MSAPYILDEMPLMDDLPSEEKPVYLDVPSLENSLFNRNWGTTIYGSNSPSSWVVSTVAYAGKGAFSHWMSSLPVFRITWLFALILLRRIRTESVTSHGWVGKAILVSGGGMSEAHFLMYSETLDVSLDLHLELRQTTRLTYEQGLGFLKEIRPH